MEISDGIKIETTLGIDKGYLGFHEPVVGLIRVTGQVSGTGL